MFRHGPRTQMPRFLMTLRSWRARRRPISVSLHLVLGAGVQGLRGEGFIWSMDQGPYCRRQHIYIPCYWDSKNRDLISETTMFLQNTMCSSHSVGVLSINWR